MFKKPLLIVGLFVILAAIPLTVFLSQQQQEIRQHATNSYPPDINGGPPDINGGPPDINGGPPDINGGPVSPIGYLDSASCDAITGWTCDADDYNSQLRVDFYTTDDPTGQGQVGLGNATANFPRESAVGAQCGGNSNHGFSFAVPANSLRDGKPHNIYAYGINVGGGTNQLLTGSPRFVTCSAPIQTSPPTASITGPSAGTIGQNLTYNAQFSNGGSATVFVSRQDNNTFTCPPGIFTDSTGRKWCVISTLTGNSTTVFTPQEAGTYAVLVNAYANSTATFTADKATECTGNPFGLNPTQQAQWSDCGPNDNIQLTITAATPLIGDVDRNGCVGIVDFNYWLRAYQSGTAQSGTSPDINGDGKIDLLDFNAWYKAMRSLPSEKLCK